MKKRIISTLIAVFMIMTASLGAACAETKALSFKDVNDKYWAKPNIDILVGKGGIAGYPDGTFKPANAITAGEFVKIALFLLPDIQKVDKDDIVTGSDWYKPYAEKAIEVGIVPDGMFDSSTWKKPIPRQKMAVISIKVATALGEDMNIENREALEKKFSDCDKICQYCKESVINAVGKGIVGGYPDGTFKPEGSATRAEAAAMLVRVIDASQRLAVGTTEELSGCKETITYHLGSRTYEVPLETHTMAELGIVKTSYKNGWLEIYASTPGFFYSIKDLATGGSVSPVLVVSADDPVGVSYVKKGNYYVFEFNVERFGKYEKLKENTADVVYLAAPEEKIGSVYFPEETAVRIVDMTFND